MVCEGWEVLNMLGRDEDVPRLMRAYDLRYASLAGQLRRQLSFDTRTPKITLLSDNIQKRDSRPLCSPTPYLAVCWKCGQFST